jgi:hypothetical protein
MPPLSDLPRVQNQFSIDFINAVIAGLIPGWSYIKKHGHNPDIDAADVNSTIWVGGGFKGTYGAAIARYTFPPYAGVPLSMSSTIAGDKQPIALSYLNGAGLEVEKTLNLDGQNPVPITDPGEVAISFHRAENVNFDVNNEDRTLGNLFVYDSGAGVTGGAPDGGEGDKIYGIVRSEEQRTSQVAFMIPSNKDGFLIQYTPNIKRQQTAGAVDFRVERQNYGGVFVEIEDAGLQVQGTSTFKFNEYIETLDPMTRILLTGNSTANDFDIGASMLILMRDRNQ